MTPEELNQTVKPDISVSAEMPHIRTDSIPSIETSSLRGETFYDKFQSIQSLNDEYLDTGTMHQKIPLTRAIRLIHPTYSNIEPKPLSFTDTDKKRLNSWFQKTLPKYGIDSIKDIDRRSFFPFLKIDPEIIHLFDYHDSDTKLGEITFRVIADTLPGKQFFKIQQYVSEFLVEIPVGDRQNSDTIKNFLEKCKKDFDTKINDTGQRIRIRDFYLDSLKENSGQ